MGKITKESIKEFLDYLTKNSDSGVRITEGSTSGIYTIHFLGAAIEQIILYEKFYGVELAFITLEDKSVYTQHKQVTNQESLEKEVLCWILKTTEKSETKKTLENLICECKIETQ